ELVGPIQSTYPAIGDIRHRQKILLLPKAAGQRIVPKDAKSGSIILHGWRCSRALTASPDVSLRTRSVGDDFFLDFELAENYVTPAHVDLEVIWEQSSIPARFRMSFTAKGVRGYDSDGSELLSSSQIAVQALFGTKIVILGYKVGSRIQLRLA